MEIDQSEVELLSKRVQKLESQSHHWKFASVLFGITTISLVVMGAKASDQVDRSVLRTRVVEAQELVLKDEDGRVYARLTLHPKLKQPGLVHGHITLLPESGYLQFYDENGKPTWTEPPVSAWTPAK